MSCFNCAHISNPGERSVKKNSRKKSIVQKVGILNVFVVVLEYTLV